MPVTAQFLRNIMAEARPIIERQMNDAKIIAGLRTVVANNGGDWGALKALIKAHVEDEADDAGDGKRVKKIVDKADDTAAYADMLGLANMNEKNFSEPSQSYAEHSMSMYLRKEDMPSLDPETGEITEHEQPETATQSVLVDSRLPSLPAAREADESAAPISNPQPTSSPDADKTGEAVPPAASPVAISDAGKPDCLKLNNGHCKIGFATPALCSACNQARMARVGA